MDLLSELGDLQRTPAQLGHCQEDIKVVFALLQDAYTLGLPLKPGLQEDSLRPQDTRVVAFLQHIGHEMY